MTRYLIITEPIDPEAAKKRKEYEIQEAQDKVVEAQLELTDALATPLVLEREREIEVLPGHPDYDKASDIPSLRFLSQELANWVAKAMIKKSPWTDLLEQSQFPEGMGDTK